MIKLEYSEIEGCVDEFVLEIVECPRCERPLLFNNIGYVKCPYCWKDLPPVRHMIKTAKSRIEYYSSNK